MSGDGVVAHNRRTYFAENVDPTRTHLNVEYCYPEKAEPVHSILATLKRFQEAPPAPKKDKAGPSHEER